MKDRATSPALVNGAQSQGSGRSLLAASLIQAGLRPTTSGTATSALGSDRPSTTSAVSTSSSAAKPAARKGGGGAAGGAAAKGGGATGGKKKKDAEGDFHPLDDDDEPPSPPPYSSSAGKSSAAAAAPVRSAASAEGKQKAKPTALKKGDPGWHDAEDVAECANCGAEFTEAKKRHHCRICGNVFCQSCTSKRLHLKSEAAKTKAKGSKQLAYKGDRVCNACYTKWTKTHPPSMEKEDSAVQLVIHST